MAVERSACHRESPPAFHNRIERLAATDGVVHDRIHAKHPSHDRQAYDRGRILELDERDGHAVVTVRPEPADDSDDGQPANDSDDGQPEGEPVERAGASDETIELTITQAVRDLFVSRLELDADESPTGCRVWYRRHGG